MLTRLTALDGETILPVADAKASQRILHTAEDDLLATFRDAAVGHVERVSGVALAATSFRWTLRTFPTRIDLPMGPVTALTSVKYYDADGAEQTYADARLVGGSVYPAVSGSWPTSYDYVAVTFTAGLSSPDDAPELIMAAKLLFGHYNRNREAVNDRDMKEVPLGVQALIDSYRKVLV